MKKFFLLFFISLFPDLFFASSEFDDKQFFKQTVLDIQKSYGPQAYFHPSPDHRYLRKRRRRVYTQYYGRHQRAPASIRDDDRRLNFFGIGYSSNGASYFILDETTEKTWQRTEAYSW